MFFLASKNKESRIRMDFEFDRNYAYLHNQQHIEEQFTNETNLMPPRNYCFRDSATERRKIAVPMLTEYANVRDADEKDPLLPYLALSYFDRYGPSHPFDNSKPEYIKYFSVCCLVLASKMRSEFFYFTDFMDQRNLEFDIEDVMKQELKVLRKLEWRMQSVTGFNFVDYFIFLLKICDRDLEYKLMMRAFRNVGRMYLGDIKFLRFRPSIIAASAVFAASSWSCYVKRALVTEEHVNRDDLGACTSEIAQQITDYALETPLIIQPPSFNPGDASANVDAETERLNPGEECTKPASPQAIQPPNFAPRDDSVAADTEILNLGRENTTIASRQLSPSFAPGGDSTIADTEMLDLFKDSSKYAPADAPDGADPEKLNMGGESTKSATPQPTQPHVFAPGDAADAPDTEDLNLSEQTTKSPSPQPAQPSICAPGGAADIEMLDQGEDNTKSALDDVQTEKLNLGEESTKSAAQPPFSAPGDVSTAADKESLNLGCKITKSLPGNSADTQKINLGGEESIKSASSKQPISAPEDASESEPSKQKKPKRKQKKKNVRSFY